MQILYIGLGGFLGAIMRFLISRFVGSYFTSFPLGTLIVNVTGSPAARFYCLQRFFRKKYFSRIKRLHDNWFYRSFYYDVNIRL